MAKDKIVEQYLEQLQSDHDKQIQEFNEYIAELEQMGMGKGGKGVDVGMTAGGKQENNNNNASMMSSEFVVSLKAENSNLKKKIAETEQLVDSLRRESEVKLGEMQKSQSQKSI